MTKPMGRVLIVDDEEQICKCLALIMEHEGLVPLLAFDGESALRTIQAERPDAILLDVKMPGINGMDVLEQALKIDPDLPAIMMSGYADTQYVVQAMRMGAYDYLIKPIGNKEIIQMVVKALTDRRLKKRTRPVPSEDNSLCSLSESMGPTELIQQISQDVNRVAQSNFTALIVGETGAGKELVARAIHNASPRAQGPFVPVDCGAIPDSLIESELFGHEEGAFTGAGVRKQGKFELAKNGTLFLDEISNMPFNAQAKLLRALQEKVIYRVGGTQPIPIDIRVVTACNQDLQSLIVAGRFRQDLYFRLNEFTIKVPPLRQRREDILYLAKRFLDLTNMELQKNVIGFSESVIGVLLSYDWPGNVRQLRSTIRRAVLLADDVITDEHLDVGRPAGLVPPPVTHGVSLGNRSLKEIVHEATSLLERNVLFQVLNITAGNKAKAARLLQIDYKTIHSKIKDYGIDIKGGIGHGEKAQCGRA